MFKENLEYNKDVKANTDLLNKLKVNLPEFFTEEKYDSVGNKSVESSFDLEKFKLALQEQNVNELSSGYRLDFVGKNYAKKQSGERPISVIVPNNNHNNMPENKASKNIYFTGDNLEVLRHMQQNYQNSIDVIYIDPPYNTGSDGFVYPDNFEYTDDQLVEMFGLNSEELSRLKSIQGKSTHSSWLTFMYPRLYLAKKLLSEEGVIFVSIDDNEKDNLTLLMNDIFGENSFLANLIWDMNNSAQSGIFKVYHQYVLAYAKKENLITTPKSDNNELFSAIAIKKVDSRHPIREFTFPAGTRFDAADGTELKGTWGGSVKVTLVSGRLIAKNGKTTEDVTLAGGFTQMNQMKKHFNGVVENYDSRGQKIHSFYLNSSGLVQVVKYRGVETPPTVQRWGNQTTASNTLSRLFESEQPLFDSPKPVDMIKDLIRWFSKDDSIILDFFAGSGTSAEAVMRLNTEDNGNRQFILCNIDEKTYTTSEYGKEVPTNGGKNAYEAGYKTIDELSRNRIERAAYKLKKKYPIETLGKDFEYKHYNVVKPEFGELERLEYSSAQQISIFDNKISSFSSENFGVEGDTPGEDTVLHTYLAKDGYKFDVKIERINFNGIVLPYVNNQRIYIIAEDWTDINTKALVNAIGTNQITVQTIVVYGYIIGMESLRELEIAIKQLNTNINLLVRY